MPKTKKPVGFLVYEGPSVLDPSVPIAVIVNRVLGNATNAKTGAMAQSFIIRTDMKPNDAVKTGQDHAICGMCPYAGTRWAPSARPWSRSGCCQASGQVRMATPRQPPSGCGRR